MKIKSIIPIEAALLLVAFSLQPSALHAQGSLTPPPGAPAPTMLTLNQIEPRTPINTLSGDSQDLYVISKPGSYYLTTNITATSYFNAISINASGVTLDLNGFTISSTSTFDTGTAIFINAVLIGPSYICFTDITISNGHITGGVTNKAGVYGGPGFGHGIRYFQAGPTTPPYNVRVTGVSVSGCLYNGISLGTGNSTVVESCTVNNIGGVGIEASSVSHSTANQCGSTAIIADTASDCYGDCSGSGDGLYASFAANNCYGNSGNGNGIYASASANNCYGNSSGGGDGLYAFNNAENCYGISSGGFGIRVYNGNANNCYGLSNSGTGLLAGANAINCYGTSSGAGDGLDATAANNCYGYSTGTGDGLNVYQVASGCYGYSGGNGNGVQAGVANTCSGYANGSGSGLSASTAFNCIGTSTTGTGLVALFANFCIGTGSPNENVAYKYNMP
jgi:hypothetical protein